MGVDRCFVVRERLEARATKALCRGRDGASYVYDAALLEDTRRRSTHALRSREGSALAISAGSSPRP